MDRMRMSPNFSPSQSSTQRRTPMTRRGSSRARICSLLPFALLLLSVSHLLSPSHCLTSGGNGLSFAGGLVDGLQRLSLAGSPYTILEDVVVNTKAKLEIEAGVEMSFAPRKGVIVYGVLVAKGTPDQRILFTRTASRPRGEEERVFSSTPSVISSSVQWPSARLVDGDLPSEGRLQVKYRDEWHSVCTNSKNWTLADIRVVCNQLGFRDGLWYQWFPKFNESKQLMYENPNCNGTEGQIQECRHWGQRQIGSGICDYHTDIGIRCSKSFLSEPNFWTGFRFIEASHHDEYIASLDKKMKRKTSDSLLENVVITYAGEESNGEAGSAVHAIGLPPRMRSVEVKWSISTGINITDPPDSVVIENSLVAENRGYGIFINTSWGDVNLHEVRVENNGADGIRYNLHEEQQVGKDFCLNADLGDRQGYPIRLTHEQSKTATTKNRCCLNFLISNFDNNEARLTAHFPYLLSGIFEGEERERGRSRDGFIEVYDGFRNTLVSKFDVRNDTRPQSITSTDNRLRICYTPAVLKRVLFTVVVVADVGRAYDLNITKSQVTGNNGRGVWVENQRSGLVLNHTLISNNSYVAGVHVRFGGGDVIVNNSIIQHNVGDGINVSLSSGYKHFDRSKIMYNTLRGIAIWFNESSQETFNNYSSQITYSEISSNRGAGLFMGNVCRTDAFWNISMNTFLGNEDDSIVLLSCLDPDAPGLTDLLITHNKFVNNQRLALRISPALRLKKALIEHNLFRFHKQGVLYINNHKSLLDDPLFEVLEANIVIKDNLFTENSGLFVANIGVQEESSSQSILFTRNTLSANMVNEAYVKLNPRSRVAAVVVVSSSNTQVIRNNFMNPSSKFEIGAHLESHSKVINASFNYFDNLSTAEKTLEIYERIFDRKNRYNLAQVEFLQYRIQRFDFNTNELLSQDKERDKFIPFRNGQVLGGEVRGEIQLEAGTYSVTKDIFIRPGSRLVLNPDTILSFDLSVGLMVQGRLDSVGTITRPIKFTGSGVVTLPDVAKFPARTKFAAPILSGSKNATKPVSNPNNRNSPVIPKGRSLVNASSTLSSKSTVSAKSRTKRASIISGSVRLSNGFEGKLEVQVNGKWGSVCSYGFDIEDAAVACQQLGLVLNARDWLLEKSQFPNNDYPQDVMLSNIRCSAETDTDFTRCKAERDFEASCPSEVGIRCYPPSWSGIRLGMVAEQSVFEFTEIDKAGLLDYSTYSFKPALQIDFNRHRLKYLNIHSNSDSGIGLMWSDVFLERDSLKIKDSTVISNGNHGIVTRSQGLQVSKCQVSSNRESGFHYNPMFTKWEQKDLVSWIAPNEKDRVFVFPSESIQRNKTVKLDPQRHSFWYLKIDKNVASNFEDWFFVETQSSYMIGVMVLNPVFGDATDNLTISNMASLTNWELKLNLSSFPMLNYGYKLKFTYKSGEKPRGNIILYLTTKPLPSQSHYKRLIEQEEEENKLIRTISLESNSFRLNGRGILSNHYNRDIGENDDYFHRHSNESIILVDNLIESNRMESLFIHTPFYDPLDFTLAEINYTLINNRILQNKRGIVQYNRDIRNSNNLFHWVINGSIIENNSGSGVKIRLPYVWQFNENYTHSVSIHNNTIVRNKNFDFIIDGHFARFNMSDNLFKDNQCKEGLITIMGMEKEMLIQDNIIEGNLGHYMVEFNLQSHADKFGAVPANFQRNTILSNRNMYERRVMDIYHPQSYTIALRGVQFINITRNLMNNPNLQFELLAGVLTGSLDNMINVEENWWGTFNATRIRDRIFDFDDWNSYAIADFTPFLGDQSVGAVTVQTEYTDTNIQNLYSPFGGRVHKSLTLRRRAEPYVIKSDLTIMPGASLTVEAGVVLEFYPSVGLLVLGDMTAAGTDSFPITMRPAQWFDERTRFKRSDYASYEKALVAAGLSECRLCISESCREWDETKGSENQMKDGFLEVYNKTTLQWIAVCDSRFTERNAQVVCKQLGYSSLNVHLKRGRRLDMGPTLISRVRFWPEPLECEGKEGALGECDIRLSGYGNHSHACTHDGEEFVYVFCGIEPVGHGDQYWGGIRFAEPTFEKKSEDNFKIPTRSYYETSSRLQHVNIVGAGILHGEKTAAIQMVQRDVNMEFVNVSLSASHAIEVIAPLGHLIFHGLNLKNNLGAGMNYLLLGGGSTETPNLPYKPLKASTIPYNLYGLVDICDTNKNLIIEERVLLYYKYDNRPVDCVKIFTSSHQIKRIGFRMLQFNLFNSTNFAAQPDSVRVFNGDIFNETVQMIADLGVTEEHRRDLNEDMFYSSSEDSLSVRLHASGASETFGFIAEVVTLPVSYYVGRGLFHNTTFSEISRNTLGAIVYKSAGEQAPAISMDYNQIEDNCIEMFGNFTSCKSALDLELQNTPQFFFRNNLVKGNQGGLRLHINALTAAAALNGVLMNNLFVGNKNNEALFVQGPQTGSFQIVDVMRNYFTLNVSPYKDNIVLAQVVANFTQNVVVANTGKHQMDVLGFERVPLSYQTIRQNWFYNNVATKMYERSTIFAGNAGQRYVDNYFVNPENDFELATMNRSDLIETNYKRSSIDARNNWWGFNETGAIAGRIRDKLDYVDYVKVDVVPFCRDNSSVLSSICSGGWEKIGHTCFLYIGAKMNFKDAKKFCENNNSTMPVIRANEYELTKFLYRQQDHYDSRFYKVWVQSFNYDAEECSILVNGRIYRHNCNDLLPFLCEQDPDISITISHWYREPLGIAALTISTITALLTMCCLCCWLCKSRERHNEKLQRRNSIRASIHSNRSFASCGSLSEIAYRRQIEKAIIMGRQQQPEASQVTLPLSSTTAGVSYKSNGSVDSLEKKSPSQFGADSYDEDTDSRSYNTLQHNGHFVAELEDRFERDPKLENANVNLMVRPTFDLTYENQGFKETPSASRASNPTPNQNQNQYKYLVDREWSPVYTTTSSLDAKPMQRSPSPSPYEEYCRRSPPAPHHEQMQFNFERPQRHDMLTFASRSRSSLLGANSETTDANHSAKTYLETSLDGDSIIENNYEYCDYGYENNKFSPSVSTQSLSSGNTSRDRPPLETAM